MPDGTPDVPSGKWPLLVANPARVGSAAHQAMSALGLGDTDRAGPGLKFTSV